MVVLEKKKKRRAVFAGKKDQATGRASVALRFDCILLTSDDFAEFLPKFSDRRMSAEATYIAHVSTNAYFRQA
jgi:hypothetical protein